MSKEDHPNLHCVAVVTDLYSSIEKHLRGEGAKQKKKVMSDKKLRDAIVNTVCYIEQTVNDTVGFEPEGKELHPHRPKIS